MTSNLSLISEDNRRIQYELKKYANLCEQVQLLEAKYNHILEELINANPELAEVQAKLQADTATRDKTKKSIEAYARETQVSVKGHGVSVSYSNPMAITYDPVKLLDIHPAAQDIPRLLKTVVDIEVMEAAGAAGMLPEEVLNECRISTPRYSNGRVQVKKLTKK